MKTQEFTIKFEKEIQPMKRANCMGDTNLY